MDYWCSLRRHKKDSFKKVMPRAKSLQVTKFFFIVFVTVLFLSALTWWRQTKGDTFCHRQGSFSSHSFNFFVRLRSSAGLFHNFCHVIKCLDAGCFVFVFCKHRGTVNKHERLRLGRENSKHTARRLHHNFTLNLIDFYPAWSQISFVRASFFLFAQLVWKLYLFYCFGFIVCLSIQ